MASGDEYIFSTNATTPVPSRELTAIRLSTRFSHTKIPGQEPLHSEAIDAGVLAAISDGRQLLRGNTRFGAPVEGWR